MLLMFFSQYNQRAIQLYYLFHCCLLICMNNTFLYFLLQNINQGSTYYLIQNSLIYCDINLTLGGIELNL